MKKTLLIILSLAFFSFKAQKKLRVGEKIQFSNVEVLNSKGENTKIDLPNGKLNSDKFVLVLFYTTSQPMKQMVELNQKIEQILNRFQNNPCKGAGEIEYVTVCADEDDAKWKKYLNDCNLNTSKFTGKKTNYLAKNGVTDKAVQVFGVDKFPSFFMVNPKGRLWIETDSTKLLEKAFVNICKSNAAYSTADIAGKLLIGDLIKKPLTDLKIYLVNQLSDTVKTTQTDNYGDFIFTKVDTTQKLSMRLSDNEKTKGGPKVYLAKQTGEVVTEIRKSENGLFEYKLLKADVVSLSPIEEEDDILFKYKNFDKTGEKKLSVSENIYYETGKFNITFEGELVLDQVLSILQSNPNVKLEVISHTDARGDDGSNLVLSQKRSNAGVDYLVSKGIVKLRLKAIGKGESMIKNRCVNGIECSDKEHEFNRRTEFNFTKD